MAAPFDQTENSRGLFYWVHIVMLNKYGCDIYGNFGNPGVLTKMQMECKQMQVINPLKGPQGSKQD